MAIIWRDTMEVGNVDIDNDHRQLIQIINSIEEKINSNINIEAINKTLIELEIYTDKHFGREEFIMKNRDYPRYYHHFKEHFKLKTQLSEIKRNFIADIKKKKEDYNPDKLIQLLHDWLIDHVIKEDLLMRPYVK